MVTHAVETLVEAGLTELLLVTGGEHVGDFARSLGSGHEFGIDPLVYASQDRAGGIAEALGLARRFVGDERVLVMLADNIFERSLRPAIENFRAQERGARVILSRRPRARAPAPPRRGRARRRPHQAHRREAGRPAQRVRGDRHLHVRRGGVGRAADARAVGPRRAGDHRREQLVRRAGDDGVRRGRGLLGRRGRVDRRVLQRSTTSSGRSGDRAAAGHPADAVRGRARLVLRADARQARCRSRCARPTSPARGKA